MEELVEDIKILCDGTLNDKQKGQNFQSKCWRYQFALFLMTQTGYFAVTGSMLSTTFFDPSKDSCNLIFYYKNSTVHKNFQQYRQNVLKNEFYSLAMEWQEECDSINHQLTFSNITILAPLLLMTGAIFGSFCAGFLADRFGRKPIVVGSMFFVCLSNLIIAVLGNEYTDANSPNTFLNKLNFSNLNDVFYFVWQSQIRHFIVFSAFFVMGASCGGYMVTNTIFLVEAINDSPNLRLLSVALNGWPIGMIFVAIIGSLCAHWCIYHLILSATAIFVMIFLEIFSVESFHWHLSRGDHFLAAKVQNCMEKKFAKSLTKQFIPIYLGDTAIVTAVTKKLSIQSQQKPLYMSSKTSFSAKAFQYSYMDLFCHKRLFIKLAKLSFCFFSSSVVSYGFFFLVDVLPGSRYVNVAVMGGGKFILGFFTFLISFFVGRRPIMIISLAFACVLCWILVAIFSVDYFNNLIKTKYVIIETKNLSSINIIEKDLTKTNWQPPLIAWLALALTAILDPTWKINHLYSMELFPTQVRNMSRGFCNVAARFGSLSGPLVILLRTINAAYPFWMFSVLLTIQWAVSFSLPETKHKELPQKMPTKKSSILSLTAIDSSNSKLLLEKKTKIEKFLK